MSPETFYKTFQSDDKLSPLSHELCAQVSGMRPRSVLDFGSGSGKHAAFFNDRGIETMTVDISMMNVIRGYVKYDLPCVVCSNERILHRLTNFDVVMTCSVLDHIEMIDEIIKQFKRIAKKAVIIAETQFDNPKNMYFYHDYEKYGFVETGFSWQSDALTGDGNLYKIWKCVG